MSGEYQQLKNQKISLWLFFSNFPPKWKQEKILQIFASFGNILDVRLPMRASHLSRIAYVNFESMTCASNAIRELNNQQIDGFKLIAKWLDTEQNRLGIGQNDDHKLFIGSLPRQATTKDLYDVFSLIGQVEAVRLDQKSFWAFIDYKNKQSALLAIRCFDKQVYFCNSPIPIDVRFKQKKYNSFMKKKNVQQSLDPIQAFDDNCYIEIQCNNQIYFKHINTEQIHNVRPKVGSKIAQFKQNRLIWYQIAQQQSLFINDLDLHNKKFGPTGANLFLFHLPNNLQQSQVRKLFSKYGNVISTRIMTEKNGKSKGIGFVSYDSPKPAQLAIEQMNGFEIKGKRLKVELNKKDYQILGKSNSKLQSFDMF